MKNNTKTNAKSGTKTTVPVKDLPAGAGKEKSVKGGALNFSFNVTN